MAHAAQLTFVAMIRQLLPSNFSQCQVLEIGSYIVNASCRCYFQNCSYLGCDLGIGPGVDLVEYGHKLILPDNKFDTVISCEALEHDEYWDKTFANMYRMSKNLVLFTCAGTGRAEHGTKKTQPGDSRYTLDYYHNLTEEEFAAKFDFNQMFEQYEFITNNTPELNKKFHNEEAFDLYFWGIKKR